VIRRKFEGLNMHFESLEPRWHPELNSRTGITVYSENPISRQWVFGIFLWHQTFTLPTPSLASSSPLFSAAQRWHVSKTPTLALAHPPSSVVPRGVHHLALQAAPTAFIRPACLRRGPFFHARHALPMKTPTFTRTFEPNPTSPESRRGWKDGSDMVDRRRRHEKKNW